MLDDIPLRRPLLESMDPYEKAAQIWALSREASRKYMQRKGLKENVEKAAEVGNSRRNTTRES